jgi:hypothetical protein
LMTEKDLISPIILLADYNIHFCDPFSIKVSTKYLIAYLTPHRNRN